MELILRFLKSEILIGKQKGADMGDTKDRVGAAGVIVAGGFFKIALYVCVAVLIIWIGKDNDPTQLLQGSNSFQVILIDRRASRFIGIHLIKTTEISCVVLALHYNHFWYFSFLSQGQIPFLHCHRLPEPLLLLLSHVVLQ